MVENLSVGRNARGRGVATPASANFSDDVESHWATRSAHQEEGAGAASAAPPPLLAAAFNFEPTDTLQALRAAT